MLKFKHEELVLSINECQRSIDNLLKQLRSGEKHDDAIWELGTLLEDTYTHNIRIDYEEVFIRCSNKISPDAYEELFDLVCDVYKDHGYMFDEKHSSNNRFKFTQHLHNDIYASISTASCEYKETGRMVPEMKSDCSVIRG